MKPLACRIALVLMLARVLSLSAAQPEQAPQPRPQAPPREVPLTDPLGPGRRLPLLPGETAAVGTTPQPSKETLREYAQFVEGRIDPKNTLDLVLNRPTVLVFKQVPKRLQIGDEKLVADLQITPRELSLTGKQVGTTVLNLWFADPGNPQKDTILSYLVRVLPDTELKRRLELVYEALEREVNRSFPNSVIHLALVGDKLVVSGQAHDVAEGTHILRILRASSPGQAARIPVDRIELNLNAANLGPEGLPEQGLDNFLVAGGANIINLLKVPGEQQVMLKVTVAEVNRSAVRSIGVNFNINNNSGLVFSQMTGNLGSGAAGAAGAMNSLANLVAILDHGKITAFINALRTLNFARSLAEPTLVALHGQTASFHAGGQFPVPVVTGFTSAGLQGVSFVPFGVQLSFTPLITDKDRIRLQVSAEVSTRDLASATSINGASVSGLNTRNFQSVVELREGQTLAVAGLIQNNFGADATRIPGFGDLPIIGRLGAFDRTSAGEQELLILITPELVRPLDGKDCPPLPGADVFEPGDIEFYLLGRLESRRPYDYRSPVMTDIHRMIKYRHCEQEFIFGPQGHSDGKN